jgi:hypothetical protein
MNIVAEGSQIKSWSKFDGHNPKERHNILKTAKKNRRIEEPELPKANTKRRRTAEMNLRKIVRTWREKIKQE